VEWVREMNHSILRGSVRQHRNVAVICRVDLMNKESANAMLKPLEEPPDNTVIIVSTERPYAVLPTIVSRCQLMRFGYVSASHMAAALGERFSLPPGDVRVSNAVRCAEGSLGKAIALMQQPLEEFLRDAHALLTLCGGRDWHDIACQLEQLVSEKLDFGREYGAAERMLTYMVYLVRDGFLGSLGAPEKYIRKEFSSQMMGSGRLEPSDAGEILDACQKAIAGVRARANVHMVLVTFLMSVMGIVHGEERSPR
jgi:DNA polymerase-3 subunit delta'